MNKISILQPDEPIDESTRFFYVQVSKETAELILERWDRTRGYDTRHQRKVWLATLGINLREDGQLLLLGRGVLAFEDEDEALLCRLKGDFQYVREKLNSNSKS